MTSSSGETGLIDSMILEVDKKLKPLTVYLQATGAIRGAKIGRKPKKVQDTNVKRHFKVSLLRKAPKRNLS